MANTTKPVYSLEPFASHDRPGAVHVYLQKIPGYAEEVNGEDNVTPDPEPEDEGGDDDDHTGI